ncbi:glycosyltransferase [bacterium]|nr:glycosyltransferase [bacterium]
MPDVAVIIPSGDRSRDDSLQGLLQDLQRQTVVPREIEVVRGVAPNGHARNTGVARTMSPYLVFLDDDVRLGSDDVIEKLVAALENPEIGLSGTSQVLPLDSTPFQRRCAQEISRSQSPVVEVLTDSDMVTTQCCATRRDVLERLGGFHGKILRGVDPELRHRYRQAGLRIVIVPQVWHYHPMPSSWKALWKMAYRNGYSSAFAQKHFPDTVLYNPEGHVDRFEARPSFVSRITRRLGGLLGAVLGGRWGGLVYDLAYASGYLRFRLLGPE